MKLNVNYYIVCPSLVVVRVLRREQASSFTTSASLDNLAFYRLCVSNRALFPALGSTGVVACFVLNSDWPLYVIIAFNGFKPDAECPKDQLDLLRCK